MIIRHDRGAASAVRQWRMLLSLRFSVYMQMLVLSPERKRNIIVCYIKKWRRMRIWTRSSLWCNKYRFSFIIIQLEFVGCHPCLYVWNAIIHALDCDIYLPWTERIAQLSVGCKRLFRNGMLSKGLQWVFLCTKWIEWAWGQSLVERQSSASSVMKVCCYPLQSEFYWKCRIGTSWELDQKFHRGVEVFERQCCD